MAQSGASAGADVVIAKAHHGSVSKEQRALIEDDLKRGRLPCVVATSSLELGIDMGAVDLVIQIESPPQRRQRPPARRPRRPPGRRGVARRALPQAPRRPRPDRRRRRADAHRRHRVACASRPTRSTCSPSRSSPPPPSRRGRSTTSTTSYAAARRSPRSPAAPSRPPSTCSAGATPPTSSPSCGPRVVWDRVGGTITGRPGAQRLAVTSGGTIPDRGLFGVFLVGEGPGSPGRRARRGDGLRVPGRRRLRPRRDQLADRGHHPRPGAGHPAPGIPGRLPFWKGDALGRPAELGEAIGGFTRELAALPAPQANGRGPRGRPRRLRRRQPGQPTSTSRSRRPASCRATARCWSSGSATSSATGGWSCTPPTARPSTRPGRWPSTRGSASATASTARRWPPTTAS